MIGTPCRLCKPELSVRACANILRIFRQYRERKIVITKILPLGTTISYNCPLPTDPLRSDVFDLGYLVPSNEDPNPAPDSANAKASEPSTHSHRRLSITLRNQSSATCLCSLSAGREVAPKLSPASPTASGSTASVCACAERRPSSSDVTTRSQSGDEAEAHALAADAGLARSFVRERVVAPHSRAAVDAHDVVQLQLPRGCRPGRCRG